MKKLLLPLLVICLTLSCTKEPPNLTTESPPELVSLSAKKDPQLERLKELFAASYPDSDLNIKWQQMRFVAKGDTILALAPVNAKLEDFGIERDPKSPLNDEEKKVKPAYWLVMLKTPHSDALKGDTLSAIVSIALPTIEYHKRSKSKKDYANALYPMDFYGTIFVADVDRKISSFKQYSDGRIEEHSHELDIFATNGKDPDPNTDAGTVYCTCCGRYFIKDGVWDEVYGGELEEFIVGIQQMIRDSGIGLFCSMYREYCDEREPCGKCQQYSCICPKPDPGDGGGGEEDKKEDNGDGGDPPDPEPDPDPIPEEDEDKEDPCRDTQNNKANPLVNMVIVPTGANNIENGDYLGRGGGHYGIDLGVDGDAIYSMFDGKVERVTNHWDPNMKWVNYPDKSPSAKTGNRVEYSCYVNGKKIYIQCWHMSEAAFGQEMVGKNIPTGTLLGYVGETGNASGFGSGGAHLHLQIRLNNSAGTILNPHDYIYSKYSKDNNGKHTNGVPNNPCD